MNYISDRALLVLLMLVGLYFPSSKDGSAGSLLRFSIIVSAILLAVLALRVGIDGAILLRFSVPIVAWLGLCTLPALFRLHDLTLTPLALFGSLAFLFAVKAGKLRCEKLTGILAAISIANVCLAISMLAFETAGDFMVAHYNDFTDDLLPGMVVNYKPVLTFATHSLAGTFFYLFFWLNFRTYQKTGKKLHLALALLHVGMCVALMSITSIGFGLLALVELAWTFPWASVLAAIPAYLLVPVWMRQSLGDLFLSDIWFREGGGFRARYLANGILANAVSYIHDHPLQPIGLMYSRNLFGEGAQTDSGPLGYFLRGSFVLVLLIYGGFFLYLRRNLHDRWDCYRLFFIILVAEIGFTVLTYPRSFLLLPAFVIYLNSLPQAAFAKGGLQSVPISPKGVPCPG